MKYFGIEQFDTLFKIIYEHFVHHETAPNYLQEKTGVEKLKGIMEGVKMDKFYPTMHDKAAYLLIQINKGHFFSNGNKRIALVFALFFIFYNGGLLNDLSKKEYRNKLEELFPNCQSYKDYSDFNPEEFGYYNLSIIIADADKYTSSFDELKQGVINFLNYSLK